MVRERRFNSGAAYVGVFLNMIIDRSERQANGGGCGFVRDLSTLSAYRVARDDLLVL